MDAHFVVKLNAHGVSVQHTNSSNLSPNRSLRITNQLLLLVKEALPYRFWPNTIDNRQKTVQQG